MKWKNLGRIFNPLNYSRHHHLQTHASNPTVYKIDNKKVRVFYSGRDKKKILSIGAFDFCLKNKKIINTILIHNLVQKIRFIKRCFSELSNKN